jgi:hypothetical protein
MFAAAIGVLSFGTVQAQDRALQWVDNTGKFKVDAEFVRIDGTQVVLKRTDGKEIKIPFDRLSPESLKQAQAMGKGSDAAASTTASSAGASGSTPITRFPADADAKTFVDMVRDGLQAGNTIVIWDALPPNYQKDIEGVVTAFAKRLDSRTFDMVRKTRNTVIDILKKQKTFILNSSVLQIPSEAKADIERSYPQGVAVLESYLAKELLDGKRLQKGDLRSLLDPYFRNIQTSAEAVVDSLPDNNPMKEEIKRLEAFGVGGFPYEVKQISATKAEITFQPPPGAPSGNPPPVSLTLAEGRWLPTDMVSGWESGMQQAKAMIGFMNPDMIHQGVSSFLFLLNAPLNNLKNSKTQEDFDRNLQELQNILQQSVPMPGGPGFGPPGGPGFPPPGGAPGSLPPGSLPPGGQPNQPPTGGAANNGSGQVSIDQ